MKDTSKLAYDQIKPDLNRQQNLVLEALTNTFGTEAHRDFGGFVFTKWPHHSKTPGICSSFHLSKLWDMDYEMVRKRMGELEKLGLVKDSGKRGKTSSGRSTIIWQLVDNPALKSDK